MRTIVAAFLSAFCLAATSQSQDSRRDDATLAILHVHELDRQAFLKGDAADLASRLDDHIAVVSEGNITTESREAMYKRFVEEFQKTEHSAWEDVEQPVIRASEDGMMAWGAFNVRSHYVEKHADGKPTIVDATISWLSTYEKKEGRWVVTALATTYPSESQ